MIWVLGTQGRERLGALFGGGSLLAFDYDGTLAPIVEDPAQARMRASTYRHLALLTRLYPVAIITGRARRDVLPFLQGLSVLDIIGNHGSESFGGVAPVMTRRIREWRDELSERLEGMPGIRIEDKQYSLSVHYRTSPDPALAQTSIRRIATQLDGARVIGGKHVVNIVQAGAPDKGTALRRLRKRIGEPATLFVGDDDTDEDAFAAMRSPRFFGVRIGESNASAAEYFLRKQEEIDELLEVLETGAHRRSSRRDHLFG